MSLERKKIPTYLGYLATAFLLAFPFVYSRADYDFIMHLWITAFYYAILASSWSLLAGYAGQFSFGHMAFMAIGAYGAALYSNYIRFVTNPTGTCTEIPFFGQYLIILDAQGVTSASNSCLDIARETLPRGTVITQPSVWTGILIGVLLGALFGFLIGRLVLRLRATYLALFTIGFSEILRAAISAEIDITQGQAGLELPPLFPVGIFGYAPTDKLPTYYVMLFVFIASMGIMTWLVNSRFGLFVRSIREDEEAAAALGVNVVKYKVRVFVITSTIAAAAGALQGHYIGIITPNILIILQMSLVIAMAVIGGVENIYAAAIGAIIIQFVLEFLRNSFDIGPFVIDMSIWRLVVFGLILMLTLRFQRNGLIQPLLDWFSRSDVAAETVAIRQQESIGEPGGGEA